MLDVDSAIPDFNREQFWKEISDRDRCHCPRTNDIELPTLCFMHKWLGMTLFPRADTCTVRIDELKLMFAMVKQRKVSPVQFMIHQWLEVFDLTGDIKCTSLVTRIAENLGQLEHCLV